MPIGAAAIRSLVQRRLRGIETGRITFRGAGGEFSVGRSVDDLPDVCVEVTDARFYREALFGGALGVAESYLAGHWDCDHLVPLLQVALRNRTALDCLNSWTSRRVGAFARWAHRWRANTRRGSRRNIAAHYDLGNDFFAEFLDPTMTYSSGYFATSQMSMEEASIAKYERLANWLDLQENDRVLEIGGGWGGFAEHVVATRGCRVTTTTISSAQFEYARRWFERAGVAEKIELLKTDYRDLQGSYDKLISIEMIEAVGHEYLPQFFDRCRRLLKPGGKAALQAITIPDERYAAYRKNVDFIQRYVFPGGCLPSLGAMASAAAQAGGLGWRRYEDLAPHYALTLAAWHERFVEREDRIRALGAPDRLLRIWRYYFAYCEAAFRERAIGLAHILLEKEGNA
ncbi:MAG: class I SAM-dependent methyltransferase [Planctomycetales bacterium]|nr:class I SAM-dependent methyltransferase [Planctomycetales bacterium]